MKPLFHLSLLIGLLVVMEGQSQYDVIIRGGMLYDGTGHPPLLADIGIIKDTIAFIGNLSKASSKKDITAKGMAVAPGFINMLSWADGSLLKDGRSMSDILQGVTLEVFGEGISPGPRIRSPRDKRWKTLGGYFDHLEQKGVSTNFASFVGATTVRDYVLGQENRKPTIEELKKMQDLVAEAMREGAMGLGSSLIYAPADYASTEELIELCKVVSSYGGMYATHMRSESDKIFFALNEAMKIASVAKVPLEIHHLKINHERNWRKIDTLLNKIDSSRRKGLLITANMYPYTASGTGLVARLPTWVQEGGPVEMRKRLKDPVVRKKVLREMELGIPVKNSDPRSVMILGFKKDSLNNLYKGLRLAEIAERHGKNADETAIDIIVADRSSVPCIFFLMDEGNLRRMLPLPYVSICSDAASIPAELPFISDGAHPRAYGSFARVLGRYVRDEKLMSLEEAIRKMTSLPASNLKIKDRGILRPGFFADVVVFDPNEVLDLATFDNPHQYAIGVKHVFVNGVQVVKEGAHTGEFPGRAVRGPGWKTERLKAHVVK